MTQRGDFGCWDWLVSGGLRYGEISINEPGIFGPSGIPAVVFVGPTGVEFDGIGPTFAAEAIRAVGCSGVSIFGRARTALLFGDVDLTTAFRTGGSVAIQDEFIQVWELQLGVEYAACIRGRQARVGVFWEAQRWDSESNVLGDIAFHGLGISAGFNL